MNFNNSLICNMFVIEPRLHWRISRSYAAYKATENYMPDGTWYALDLCQGAQTARKKVQPLRSESVFTLMIPFCCLLWRESYRIEPALVILHFLWTRYRSLINDAAVFEVDVLNGSLQATALRTDVGIQARSLQSVRLHSLTCSFRND